MGAHPSHEEERHAPPVTTAGRHLCHSVLFVSLPTNAGIADKDLPLLDGEKTKLLYTVTGVTDVATLATVFICTSSERENGKEVRLGIEVFNHTGGLTNDVTMGEGAAVLLPGNTYTMSSRATSAFTAQHIIATGWVGHGSARIVSTSKNVLCIAMVVDANTSPPASMVLLPVFRASRQGGM